MAQLADHQFAKPDEQDAATKPVETETTNTADYSIAGALTMNCDFWRAYEDQHLQYDCPAASLVDDADGEVPEVCAACDLPLSTMFRSSSSNCGGHSSPTGVDFSST